jgi:hypothetical protein
MFIADLGLLQLSSTFRRHRSADFCDAGTEWNHRQGRTLPFDTGLSVASTNSCLVPFVTEP